ncbi:MAG: hypothetical protein K6F22_10005 [Prevotella sp.]|jgi:hypothetical protein|nr:hypothetical protein [Prevotella sp.]
MYFFRFKHAETISEKDKEGGHRFLACGAQTIHFHQVQYPYSTGIQRLLSTETTRSMFGLAILIG